MRRRNGGWRSSPGTALTLERPFPVRQDTSPRLPFFRLAKVEWTPLYVAFLLYMFAIVTYRLPIGNAAMILALLVLPFQRQAFRFPLFLGIYGVFVLWAAAGTLGSAYGAIAWDAVLTACKLWLIALVAVNALRTRAQLQFYLIFVLGCFALFPARGAIFNYVGGYTLFGRALWNYIYANPNDLAALTLLQLGIAAALVTTERQKWVRVAAATSVVVLTVVVLMTQSRGALLGLAIFAVLSFHGQRKKLRSLLIGVGLVALVLLLAPAGVLERARGLVYVTSTETLSQVDPEGSAEQRYTIWRVAAEVISDHPFTGVGLGAYPEAHALYAVRTGLARIAGGKRDTHSTYLNVLAETGFPGLLIFLALIGTVLYRALRVQRRLKPSGWVGAIQLRYLNAALLAYLVAGIFGSFALLSHLYVYLALITVVTLEAERQLLGSAPQAAFAWRGVVRSSHPRTGAG
jgi:O-antigen ligase